MAGAGYRTFQSGEVLTSNNVQTYLMDQAVQVYSGTAARSSAVPSPSTGMVAYATATGLQVFNGSAWVSVGGTGYGAATGGASTATATIDGVNYTILTFTATGTLTVTTAGFFDYLAVGGGGGNAHINENRGGGGGGGGCVQIGSVYLSANQTITIGAGGSTLIHSTPHIAGHTIIKTNLAAAGCASNGSPYAATQQAIGGDQGRVAQIAKTTYQSAFGFNGGSSTGSEFNGGGGGGVGGAGGDGSLNVGGAAGAGFDVSVFIGGSALFKGMGGGGGGATTGGAAATDGVAGGTNSTPPNGNANSGGGGGGGIHITTTGNGGSGIAYIRFRT